MNGVSKADEEVFLPLPDERVPGGRWGTLLRRRVPILEWGRRYDRMTALADLVAGVTLGLTLVPQSIAYASLAGLPVQYGLYSSFIGTIVYVALGTVKEVSIGPTSLMALMTMQACHGRHVQYVVLLTFLAGAIVSLLALLRLGFLVELISPAVTSGFTSATAVLIVASQVKGLLGLSFTAESVLENVRLVAAHWGDVSRSDCAMSLTCCFVLLAMRKLKDLKLNPKRHSLRKAVWLLSISRNAVVVCIASSLAFWLHRAHDPLFKLSGKVEPGLPSLALPWFRAPVAGSNGTWVGPLTMARELGAAVFVLPLVMVLANIAIAKAFSDGGRVDASQEMLTLGACNLLGSLVQAMPTCGAFTRSAVSHASAVRTPAAGLYSGLIVLLALQFMTQYFYFIPKACLSSVLICAVIFMVDYQTVLKLHRRGERSELAVLLITFTACTLVGVELGLATGAAAAGGALLAKQMGARISCYEAQVGGQRRCAVVRPEGAALYANAERLRSTVARTALRVPTLPVALDCRNLHAVDYGAAEMLSRLIKQFEADERQLVLFNAPPAVRATLEAAGASAMALACRSLAEALRLSAPLGDASPLLAGDMEKA